MDRIEPLRAGDALFLDAESDLEPMQIGVCLVFEGDRAPRLAPDPDRLVELLESRLACFPRSRLRLATTPIERRPVWVDDDDFDARRHVRYERLASSSDDSTLRLRCAEFLREALDLRHPPWQILVLEGFAAGRYALVVKAHHCLADGVAGIEILRLLLGPDPTPEARRIATPSNRRSTRWSAGELAIADARNRVAEVADRTRRTLDRLRSPRAFVDDTLDATLGEAIGFLNVCRIARSPHVPSLLDSARGPERSLAWMETDLSRVRAAGRGRGATINDVVVATLALALGRVLEASGVARTRQAAAPIRAAIPVDVRKAAEGRASGNHISLVFATLPTALQDPVAVLDQTRSSLIAAKASNTSQALGRVIELADWIPRPIARRLTRLAMTRLHPASVVVTNVHGPDRPLALFADPLRAAYPIVPLMPGQALTVAVLSYSGRLFWAFHANPNAIPDVALIAKEVECAFEDLHAAIARV